MKTNQKYLIGGVLAGIAGSYFYNARRAKTNLIGDAAEVAAKNAAVAAAWNKSQGQTEAPSTSGSSIDISSIAIAGGSVILALIAWPHVSKYLK